MKEKYKNLPLRSGVGIVVLNKENKIFVAKRIDNKKNFWQMPQGGVDKGEDLYEAAIRELNEETSIYFIFYNYFLLSISFYYYFRGYPSWG